ncbi:MAG: CoA transferase [Candidatus Hydrogenedentes bacterium]|nr:CoA transferase [Candidatus Hydrogenedentota bacterium]
MPALDDVRVTCIATNIPGPVTAARLRDLGAHVTKIEPPSGDPLAYACPAWYAEMTRGMRVVTLDLKDPEQRVQLGEYLAAADLLLTSSRPAALENLRLDWGTLHAAYPKLCHVAIVGHLAPEENRAGHDLTYVAAHGLVAPPRLPPTLIADLAGAERAALAGLALLHARDRGCGSGQCLVALADAAEAFAAPLRHRVTTPQGLLGGGLPNYNLYKTKDGWLAVAALETHFLERLKRELSLARAEHEDLQAVFATRTAAEWQAWAAARDLPIAAVQAAPPAGIS